MILARPNCSMVQALVARCAVGRARVKAEGPVAMADGSIVLVEIERWRGPLPPVRAFTPPAIVEETA